MCIIHVTVHEQQVTFQGHGHVIRLLSRMPSIEERARLRARGFSRRGCAQARNADVSTKLNLPFPGVN